MNRTLWTTTLLTLTLLGCAGDEPKNGDEGADAETRKDTPPAGDTPPPVKARLGGEEAFDAGPGALNLLLGGKGGTYDALGTAVAKAAKGQGFAVQPLESPGSVENLYLVGLGRADAAFVQVNVLTEPRFALAAQWVDVLTLLYIEEVHVVVPAKSKVHSLRDLRGKKVGIGPRASGTAPTARSILRAAGLDPSSDVEPFHAGSLMSVAMVADGQLDAAFVVGGAPLPGFLNLPPHAGDSIRLLPLPAALASKAGNGLVGITIPANSYAWNRAATETLGVPCALIASKSLAEEQRSRLLAALGEKDALQAAHPKGAQVGALEGSVKVPRVDPAGLKPPAGPRLILASGSRGGTYDRFARAVEVVGADRKLEIDVLNTQGSFRNVLLLASGGAHLALVQRDVLDTVARSERFKTLLQDLRLVGPLFGEEVHLIVRRGSGITSLKGLKGKRVFMGSAGSGTSFTAEALLEAQGVEVHPVRAGSQTALMMLLGGSADAHFSVGGAPLGLLSALTVAYAEDIELVSLPPEEGYAAASIPAGAYPWAKAPVRTFSTQALLVARKEVGADVVSRLLGALLEERDNLSRVHPKWRELDPEGIRAALKSGGAAASHPGALEGVKARVGSAPRREWRLPDDDEGPSVAPSATTEGEPAEQEGSDAGAEASESDPNAAGSGPEQGGE